MNLFTVLIKSCISCNRMLNVTFADCDKNRTTVIEYLYAQPVCQKRATYRLFSFYLLGKSERAWSMYIDGNRSWFMHAGEHHTRIEGGIRVGSKVGVLLNLDAHTLNFYVNEKLCGSGPAFRNLRGIFYPAISINRHVKITLNSGINPPSNIYDED